MARPDSTFAVVLGALTFMIATVGINILANFVSPAFDLSDVNPQKVSWRTGGMIAAVGSVLLTSWNLYSSPEVIHYTLDTSVKKRKVIVDDLCTLSPDGTYHHTRGDNPAGDHRHGGRRRAGHDRGLLRLE